MYIPTRKRVHLFPPRWHLTPKSFCKMEFLKVELMAKDGRIEVFHGYCPVVLRNVHTRWSRPHQHMDLSLQFLPILLV